MGLEAPGVVGSMDNVRHVWQLARLLRRGDGLRVRGPHLPGGGELLPAAPHDPGRDHLRRRLELRLRPHALRVRAHERDLQGRPEDDPPLPPLPDALVRGDAEALQPHRRGGEGARERLGHLRGHGDGERPGEPLGLPEGRHGAAAARLVHAESPGRGRIKGAPLQAEVFHRLPPVHRAICYSGCARDPGQGGSALQQHSACHPHCDPGHGGDRGPCHDASLVTSEHLGSGARALLQRDRAGFGLPDPPFRLPRRGHGLRPPSSESPLRGLRADGWLDGAGGHLSALSVPAVAWPRIHIRDVRGSLGHCKALFGSTPLAGAPPLQLGWSLLFPSRMHSPDVSSHTRLLAYFPHPCSCGRSPRH
mmetsp:Transcript_66567/g.205851  ORF Transcript_66567/g.205851 Transcript_66567/m.205851 type:complete len:363 (+) Transcript_66567:1442-2530(+)